MAWLSTTIDSSSHFDYSYAHIYQLNAEDFVVKIHHGDILYFPTQLVNSKKPLSHHSTPCCSPKSLILACAYVEFFPVIILLGLLFYKSSSKNNTYIAS